MNGWPWKIGWLGHELPISIHRRRRRIHGVQGGEKLPHGGKGGRWEKMKVPGTVDFFFIIIMGRQKERYYCYYYS